MHQTKKKTALIANNPRASHQYSIASRIEAGITLKGWETKSLRYNRLHLKESYARLINNEIWLLGAHISPLPSCVQKDKQQDPLRTRKLLLNRIEISRLTGLLNQKGYTLIPLKAYWKNQYVKIELGLGKGKDAKDKRATEKNRDWQREKQRLLKNKPR